MARHLLTEDLDAIEVLNGDQLAQRLQDTTLGRPAVEHYVLSGSRTLFRVPETGLNPAADTTGIINCQHKAIDMFDVVSYEVQPGSELQFESCTIFLPDSDASWASQTTYKGSQIVHPCNDVYPAALGRQGDDQRLFRHLTDTQLMKAGTIETWLNSNVSCSEGPAAEAMQARGADSANGSSDSDGAIGVLKDAWPWMVLAGGVLIIVFLFLFVYHWRRNTKDKQTGQNRWKHLGSTPAMRSSLGAGEPFELESQRYHTSPGASTQLSSQKAAAELSVGNQSSFESCSVNRYADAGTRVPSLPAQAMSPSSMYEGIEEEAQDPSAWDAAVYATADIPSGAPGTPSTPYGNSISSATSDLAMAMATTVSQFKRELPDVPLEILQHIGTGGYGSVYRGTWKGLEVAIKTVVFQDRHDDDTAERVFKEAAIACNISHEHVVNSFTHELKSLPAALPGELAEYKLYIIQEFCQGGSLAKLLAHEHLVTSAGGVHIKRVLTILRQVASGISYMHSALRCIHGDINPCNILLKVVEAKPVNTPRARAWKPMTSRAARGLDDGTCTVKLGDFGLTVQLQHGRTHVSNVKQGTPFYTAPELSTHNRLQCASDVYSFGVLMWECYHNTPPFDVVDGQFLLTPTFGQFPSTSPLNYTLLAVACLSPTPEDRPSFSQVIEVLTAIGLELASGFYVDMHGTTQSVAVLAKASADDELLDAEVVRHIALSTGYGHNSSQRRQDVGRAQEQEISLPTMHTVPEADMEQVLESEATVSLT